MRKWHGVSRVTIAFDDGTTERFTFPEEAEQLRLEPAKAKPPSNTEDTAKSRKRSFAPCSKDKDVPTVQKDLYTIDHSCRCLVILYTIMHVNALRCEILWRTHLNKPAISKAHN